MLYIKQGLDNKNIKTAYVFENGVKKYLWKDKTRGYSNYYNYFSNCMTSTYISPYFYNLRGTPYEISQNTSGSTYTALPKIGISPKSNTGILGNNQKGYRNGFIRAVSVDSVNSFIYHPNVLDDTKYYNLGSSNNVLNFNATNQYGYFIYNGYLKILKKTNDTYTQVLTFEYDDLVKHWIFDDNVILLVKIGSDYHVVRYEGETQKLNVSLSDYSSYYSQLFSYNIVEVFFIGNFIYIMPNIRYNDVDPSNPSVSITSPLITVNVVTGAVSSKDKSSTSLNQAKYIYSTMNSGNYLCYYLSSRLPEGSYMFVGNFAICRFYNGDYTYTGEYFHSFFNDGGLVEVMHNTLLHRVILPNPNYKDSVPVRLLAFNIRYPKNVYSSSPESFKYGNDYIYKFEFKTPSHVTTIPSISATNMTIYDNATCLAEISSCNYSYISNSIAVSTGNMAMYGSNKVYYINGLDDTLECKLIYQD